MGLDPLLIDLYPLDVGVPDVGRVIAEGYPWAGLVLKATEGTHYQDGGWFTRVWGDVRAKAGDRFGHAFFRGAYHYLRFDAFVLAQVDAYLRAVEVAGGWSYPGDLWPIVDVERADNPAVSAAQLVDYVSTFSREVKKRTGKGVMLYGGSIMADLGVKDRMGCEHLWFPRYTAQLLPYTFQRIGWDLPAVWQYSGGKGNLGGLAGYPEVSPLGAVDLSAVLLGGGGMASLALLGEI